MEKQGFEEKEELKSKLESTMEEKFKLEKVRKHKFSQQLIYFSTLTCHFFREKKGFVQGRCSERTFFLFNYFVKLVKHFSSLQEKNDFTN